MPHDVFISHSIDDRLVALALCNKLESAGVICWIAPRDVGPGAEWDKSIVDAIRECRVMVLIFSSKANDSTHIHREVQTAVEKDLTVIPFRVQNTQPTGTMEYYLGSVHWLDALTAPVESHMMEVVDRVKALLLTPTVQSVAKSAPPIPQGAPLVTNPLSAQARPPETKPPELMKVQVSDVPPPILAPVSVTSGPAAAPLSQVAPSRRKKIIQRVLMGVVGLVAVLYGARQIASGLHLFSSKSNSNARLPAVIENEMTPLANSQSVSATPAADIFLDGADVQGCYLRVPKGWEKKDTAGVSTIFSAPKSSGLSANLIVTTEPFAGSLRQYVDATITAVKASSPGVRQVSDEGFRSHLMAAGGYKVKLSNKIKDVEFVQAIYFFDGKPGTKVAITTSVAAAQASQLDSVFDRCVASLLSGAPLR